MKTPAPKVANRSGVALVMTIIILALITIMVLGFADLVRHETVSSSTHQERGRAQFLSQMGVDTVTGMLRKQTANPALIWATKPGALVVPNDTAPTKLAKLVDLHSGYPTNATLNLAEDNPYRPANLNIQTLTDQDPPTHIITDQGADPDALPGSTASKAVKLPLRWIYVRQDGKLDFSETPVKGTANPITGRYAYWADDESSKINLNTAWKRNPVSTGGASSNTFSPSHPTAINLSSLNDSDRGIVFDQTMADQLHSFVTEKHDYTDLGKPSTVGNRYNKFFNSLYEARTLDEVSGAEKFTQALNAYKFELTHFNHDPDSTFFNEPRIVLTTQRKYAQGRPFLDILKDAGKRPSAGSGAGTLTALGGDPGRTNKDSINYTKFNKVVLNLVSYMKRNDWPMVKPSTGVNSKPSMQTKYYSDTAEYRLTQIALNIVDYVRSAESEYLLVEPTRGIMENGEFVSDIEDGSLRGKNMTYKGITRSLYITEMGVWVAKDAETAGVMKDHYLCKFFMEVHLPEGNGLDELDLTAPALKQGSSDKTNLWVYQAEVNGSTGVYRLKTPTSPSPGFQDGNGKWWLVKAENIVGTEPVAEKVKIKKGKYKTLVFEAYRKKETTADPRPTKFNGMRTALVMKEVSKHGGTTSINNGFSSDPATQRFEVAPISGGKVNLIVDNPSVAEGDIRSKSVDDPMINNISADWKDSSPRSTFAGLPGGITRGNPTGTIPDGRPNALVSSLGKASTSTPPQDTNEAGFVTDIGVYFAPPKGHPDNLKGMVQSTGELGHIHTGVEVDDNKTVGGIPFRTLRLQPSLHDNTTVPDWAFMDLFTAPVDSPTQATDVFTPHGTGVGGRVNINCQVEPYATSSSIAQADLLIRRLPLVGVLAGAPKETKTTSILSTTEARTLANNIYNRKWANASATHRFGLDTIYDSPGEIVEVEGIADKGEASEKVVRSIGNLITTRGAVFTVFSIGQAMRETRNGDLIITGEQRNQTTLERYLEININGTEDDYTDDIKTVHFRKVGARNLTP